MISIERLRELFSYDPETGELFRKRTGKACGSPHGNGYLRVNINGVMMYAHRIAFALHNGYMPEFVDHRDGKRDNNVASNLRDATRTQNNQSKLKRSDGITSRFIGVSFDLRTSRWRAQLTSAGKRVNIGRFDTQEEAAKAYDFAVLRHNGKFAKTNYGTPTVSDDHS